MLARPQSGSLRLRKLQPRPKHFPAIQFRTSGANGVAAAPYLLTRQRTQGQKRKVSAENCGKTKMRRGATWVYNKCAASDHSEPLNKKKVRQPAHNGGAVKKNAPALFRLIQQSGLAACRQAAPQVADGPELAWPAQLERAPYSSEPIRAKGKGRDPLRGAPARNNHYGLTTHNTSGSRDAPSVSPSSRRRIPAARKSNHLRPKTQIPAPWPCPCSR